MNLFKSSYNIFKLTCKERVAKYSDSLTSIIKSKNEVFTHLTKYKEELIPIIKFKYIEEFNEGNYTNSKQLAKIHTHNLTNNPAIKDNLLLISYIRAYRYYCIREVLLNDLIDLYNLYASMPYDLYSESIKVYNDNVMYAIFNGETYFFRYYIGGFQIVYKERDYSNDKRTIDWGESLKFLKELIKEKDIDLYNRYTNKLIKKSQFIAEAKKYTYDEEHNPNAPKWLINRTDDVSLWIKWVKPYNIPSYKLYSFTPTNFINTSSRSQSEFLSNCTDENQIITSQLLGNRDKCAMLNSFNPNAYNRFKDGLRKHK